MRHPHVAICLLLAACGPSTTPGTVIATDAASAAHEVSADLASSEDLRTADFSSEPDLAAPSCASYIAEPGVPGCDYYSCRDALVSCGADGYYLGFGKKYCVRFLADVAPEMSQAGQTFLAVARNCLMEYVEHNLATETDCSVIRQKALASHVACYEASGFCAIPLSDKLLLYSAIDSTDVDYSTLLETGIQCL